MVNVYAMNAEVIFLLDNYSYVDEEPELCTFCDSDSAHYVLETDDDEIGKYHCVNCNSEYKYVGTEYRDEGDVVVIKGGHRDWIKHLGENLSFPFEGYISDYQHGWPLKESEAVIVKGIESDNIDYGVIASINPVKKQSLFGKKSYSFPIADIRAKDNNSKNNKELENYGIWFTNCRE